MAEPRYTYRFADLLTNSVNIELPVYGVWFSRILNNPGNCTFSFALDSQGFSNSDVLGSTIPGRTTLYIDRDGSLIWGGVIWSRTYQAQSKSLQFNAQTFESYPAVQYIEEDLNFDGVDQRNILIQLIQHMQNKPSADIGIVVPVEYTSGGISRVVNIKKTQVWSYSHAAEYLVEFDEGFDYTIDVRYGPGRAPQKRLLVDNRLGRPQGSSPLVFDYPGNIKNYYYPENASRAATTTIGVGAGDDTGKLFSRSVQSDLLTIGYPDLQQVYTNTDVERQSTLDSQTVRAGELKRVPISVPTFDLLATTEPTIASIGLGDYASFDIVDPRFPAGKRIESRIIGWECRPTGSGKLEEVKLIIPNEDAADV